jgi:hypothetical protein
MGKNKFIFYMFNNLIKLFQIKKKSKNIFTLKSFSGNFGGGTTGRGLTFILK